MFTSAYMRDMIKRNPNGRKKIILKKDFRVMLDRCFHLIEFGFCKRLHVSRKQMF